MLRSRRSHHGHAEVPGWSHPVLPLDENIWPQIRLLPSALLLNSSAKRSLGRPVKKPLTVPVAVLVFILELLALPSAPSGARTVARAFLCLLREDVKTFWAPSLREPELSNGEGWRPRRRWRWFFTGNNCPAQISSSFARNLHCKALPPSLRAADGHCCGQPAEPEVKLRTASCPRTVH